MGPGSRLWERWGDVGDGGGEAGRGKAKGLEGREDAEGRGCATGFGLRGGPGSGPGGLYQRLAGDDPRLPPRAVLASRRVSFHKRHDGLAAVAEQESGLDPYSGVALVFRGAPGGDASYAGQFELSFEALLQVNVTARPRTPAAGLAPEATRRPMSGFSCISRRPDTQDSAVTACGDYRGLLQRWCQGLYGEVLNLLEKGRGSILG